MSMDREEMLKLADYIEGGSYVSLDDLGTRNIALIIAMLRAAPSSPVVGREGELSRHNKINAAKNAILKCPPFSDYTSPTLCALNMAEAVVDALSALPPENAPAPDAWHRDLIDREPDHGQYANGGPAERPPSPAGENQSDMNAEIAAAYDDCDARICAIVGQGWEKYRPVRCDALTEAVRRMAQGYADFWTEQSTKNESRSEHYQVVANQFQRIATALSMAIGRGKGPMTEQERLDELGPVAEAQRAVCHRLYDEWSAACKVLHAIEREQSAIFRSLSDEMAAKSLLEAKGYALSSTQGEAQ